jgi:hypothetical protein
MQPVALARDRGCVAAVTADARMVRACTAAAADGFSGSVIRLTGFSRVR